MYSKYCIDMPGSSESQHYRQCTLRAYVSWFKWVPALQTVYTACVCVLVQVSPSITDSVHCVCMCPGYRNPEQVVWLQNPSSECYWARVDRHAGDHQGMLLHWYCYWYRPLKSARFCAAVGVVWGMLFPRTQTNIGKRSFSVTAPLMWNTLPNYVRQSDSLAIFKSRLETALFTTAFDS